MTALPSILGTVPQWITAVAGSGILAALLKFSINWRGQTLDSEEKVRAHLGAELKVMRERLDAKDAHMAEMEKHWREMLDQSDTRHNECLAERAALHREIEEVRAQCVRDITTHQNEIDGLKRQIARYSADRLLVLEDNGFQPSAQGPSAVKSARRVKEITEKPRDKKK